MKGKIVRGEPLKIRVVKLDGKTEDFKPWKIIRTLQRAGASREMALSIVKKVEGTLYDGITTKEILKRVKSLIPREKKHVAIRYNLKGAIMRLGPAGFSFESFVAAVLENYGYKTKLRSIVRGRCVQHEIDIIAEKTNRNFSRVLIECKFHNQPGTCTDLKATLYTYARFLDLNEAHDLGKGDRFDEVWLVSNTCASADATKYADCRGVRLLCWRCPANMGLEKMIERKGLYPVTILPSVDKDTLNKLVSAKVLFAKDFLSHDLSYLSRTGLKRAKINKLISEAQQLIGKFVKA